MTLKRSRRFTASTLGLFLLVLLGYAVVEATPRRAPDDPRQVWREVYLMGTRARLVVETSDRSIGLSQLERTLQLLERTERELSTWREDSLLSQLNRHPLAQPWPVPAPLCRLLAEVADWHSL